MRVGLVGLGRMGGAMAARLASFDIHATAWDQSAQACAAAAARGVAVVANPCAVAQASDLVITTITEDEGVRGLFSMRGGFGEADLDGKLFIEMSTLRPQTVRDLAPMPHYVVAGQTHPKVLIREGDAYRDRLREQVRDESRAVAGPESVLFSQ